MIKQDLTAQLADALARLSAREKERAEQESARPSGAEEPNKEWTRAASSQLTFQRFSEVNRLRCESPDGFSHPLDSWSTSDWFTALLGELGEAANVAKKLNRVRDGVKGNRETADALRVKLRQELGDAFVYLDLLAQHEGFNIGAAAVEVFDAKSEELSCSIRITASGSEAERAITRDFLQPSGETPQQATAEARVTALLAGLRTYGRHQEDCELARTELYGDSEPRQRAVNHRWNNVTMQSESDWRQCVCTCGFEALITAQERTE
jgi:NTP pyrophosphatase (non-canonical NTP hydrolase)